jgi:rhodanese-related sulfurtransferase
MAVASLWPVEHDHTPAEVMALRERGEIQLVDVRTDHEHEAGRIAGDLHIELAQLAGRAAEIDPERPVVFYCRTGARSAMATQAFREAGYDARNMAGGLRRWQADGLPVEPDGGVVAD